MYKMLFFICSLGVPVSCSNHSSNSSSPRPGRDGRIVDAGEYAHMASIRDIVNRKHFCAAMILSPSYVLTSCHCVYTSKQGKEIKRSLDDFEVVAGITNSYSEGNEGQARPIKLAIIHDQCDFSSRERFINVAVLRLSYPFSTKLASLKSYHFAKPDNSSGHEKKKECSSLQWGLVKQKFPGFPYKIARFLISLPSDYMSSSECQKISCGFKSECDFIPNQYEVCFLSENSTKYDTGELGGFLMCDGHLEGIKICLGSICQTKGYPYFYTSSIYFMDFIFKFASGSTFKAKFLFSFLSILLLI